jgi:hypothetical protein
MFRKKMSQLLSYAKDPRSKDYYNDNNLDKYKSLETYSRLYRSCIEKEEVFTNTEICFSPAIKFGSTIEHVKKNNSLEYTVFKNTKDCTILFYKIKEEGTRLRLELHFFKNKLVFFKYVFRSSQGKEAILDLFSKKYLNSVDHRSLDFSKITLTDGLRNYMELDDSVFLTVDYFTFKYGFFDYVKSMRNDQRQEVKGFGLEESLLLKRI